MKHIFLFAILSLFTCFSFAQTRNLRLVKAAVENPTNQKRKAIVIGMSDYDSNNRLENTLNDADDMAVALTRLGFEVTILKNNELKSLINNLNAWYKTIEGNDMAVFYFAGHGMEVDGENYLIPVNVDLNSQTDVVFNTLNVNHVLGNMNEMRVGMKLLILDACRDNPFKRSWARGSEVKGLAQMSAPKGTYIAFAASPGFTAQDGKNYKLNNGVFTNFLKEEILKEGISIDEIFNNVTGRVSELTRDKQTPFKNSSLTKTFYFIPPRIKPNPSIDNSSEPLRKANEFFGNKQYEEAISLYEQAAKAGSLNAQNKLGNCYAYGLGVEKNYNQAVEWYRKAAEQGYDGAQNNLGICYENGYGVTKSYEQSIYWYKKAAEQGNAAAQNAYNRLQKNPPPPPVTDVKELLRKATTFFNNKQYSEAVPLYKQAAEQGNTYAQIWLGYCYENELGVTKDMNKAMEWYKKAADQGYAAAQVLLGSCYENGKGVAKDMNKAVDLYKKAAAQGDADAIKALKRLGVNYP